MPNKPAATGKARGWYIGLTATATAVTLMVFCYAIALQKGWMGEGTIKAVIALILLLSSTIGVLLSRGKSKGKRSLSSLVPALGLAVILLLGRFVFPNGGWDGTQGVLFILFSALPAVFAFGKKEKRMRH